MKRLVKLLTLAAVIAAVAALLKRRPAPPTASPTAPPTPVASKPSAAKPPMPTMPKMPTVSPTAPEPAEAASAEDAPTDDGTPWVESGDDGDCPDGYPVKAKVSSKIFHVPGGVLYDKTVADRCYATAEAAEADGYRQSLR